MRPRPAAPRPLPLAASLDVRVRALSGEVVWGPQALDASLPVGAVHLRVARAVGAPADRVRLLASPLRGASGGAADIGDVQELEAQGERPLSAVFDAFATPRPGADAGAPPPRGLDLVVVVQAVASVGAGLLAAERRAAPGLYIAEVTNHRVICWPWPPRAGGAAGAAPSVSGDGGASGGASGASGGAGGAIGGPSGAGGAAGGRAALAAGGKGRGARLGQLAGPRGIFVDRQGALYVADAGNDRVTRWVPGAAGQLAAGGLLAAGGRGRGDQPWQLHSPHGVAVDARGAVYVSERGAHRVTRWAPGAEIGEVVAGGAGAGDGLWQLDAPVGLCLGDDGSVFVSEAGNDRVTRWVPGAGRGEVVAGGRGRGDEAWQLADPRGVCLDAEGAVVVAEAENDRVTRWPRGAGVAEVVAGGRGQGNAPWQLHEPLDVCFDDTGTMYISEGGRHRVTCWRPGADRGEVLAGDRGWGSGLDGHLGSPCGVFAVAAAG